MDRNDPFYTVKEVAKMLRLNAVTIYGYIREGKMSAIKLGKNYRIAEDDLEVFIEEHKLKR